MIEPVPKTTTSSRPTPTYIQYEKRAQSLDYATGEHLHSNSDPQPSVRLYDVEADPTESYDLAPFFPEVVDDLLGRIAAHNATAVPISFPECDPAADPGLRQGVWGPWVL